MTPRYGYQNMSINIFPKGITIYHGKCVSANRSRLLGIHGVGCGLDLGDLDHSLYIFCKRPRCGTCNAAWLRRSFMFFAEAVVQISEIWTTAPRVDSRVHGVVSWCINAALLAADCGLDLGDLAHNLGRPRSHPCHFGRWPPGFLVFDT